MIDKPRGIFLQFRLLGMPLRNVVTSLRTSGTSTLLLRAPLYRLIYTEQSVSASSIYKPKFVKPGSLVTRMNRVGVIS